MASDNETVEQACEVLYAYPKAEACDGSGLIVLNNNKIADRIIAAHRREIKAVRRNAERKMQQIVRQMQFAKGDVTKCEDCCKTIAWDEYAVNFGWCDDCMNRHLEVHGLA